MNDTIKKIQVQIDYHMAELHRLQSALDVYNEFEGKPAVKEQPMFTVQKISAAPTPTAKVETKPATPDFSAMPLTAQILKILDGGKAMKKADIEAKMDFGDRGKKNASNPLNTLKAKGEVISVGTGKYALKGYTGKMTKEKATTGISVRQQVMAAFEAFDHPLSRADLLNLVNLQGRSVHTFDSCLSKLKVEGVLSHDDAGNYTLVNRSKVVGGAGEGTTDVRAA